MGGPRPSRRRRTRAPLRIRRAARRRRPAQRPPAVIVSWCAPPLPRVNIAAAPPPATGGPARLWRGCRAVPHLGAHGRGLDSSRAAAGAGTGLLDRDAGGDRAAGGDRRPVERGGARSRGARAAAARDPQDPWLRGLLRVPPFIPPYRPPRGDPPSLGSAP